MASWCWLFSALCLTLCVHATPLLDEYERRLSSKRSRSIRDPEKMAMHGFTEPFSQHALNTAKPADQYAKLGSLFFIPTSTIPPVLYTSFPTHRDKANRLRIRRLNERMKQAKKAPKFVVASDSAEEEAPFMHTSELFDSSTNTTSPLPTTSTAASPSITSTPVASPEVVVNTEKPNGLPTTTDIQAKPLEDDYFNIGEPVHRRRIPWRRHPRRRYQPDSYELDIYEDEMFMPRRSHLHRSNRRFSAIPYSYFDYDDSTEYTTHRRHPSKLKRRRPVAIDPIYSGEDGMVESVELEHEAIIRPETYIRRELKGAKTHESAPLPLSTLLQASGVKEGAGLADSKHGFIPALSQNKLSTPSPQPKAHPQRHPPPQKDLQMSPENCKKVHGYAKMFGVSSPRAWVRHNCPFVQSFVPAPCDDINAFVDSCFLKG